MTGNPLGAVTADRAGGLVASGGVQSQRSHRTSLKPPTKRSGKPVNIITTRRFTKATRFLLRLPTHLVLSRLVGWRYGGGPTARRRLVRQLPVVAFRPLRVTRAP